MAYLFKLTAKQTIGGKLPKGATFQVVEQASSSPQPKNIAAAIKQQFGIDLPSSSTPKDYFIVERVK